MAMSSSHWTVVRAMGFSSTTWMPRDSASRAPAKCRSGGVEITTRSMSPESSISVPSVKASADGARASAASILAGFVSQTAASTIPGVACTAWLCSCPMAP